MHPHSTPARLALLSAAALVAVPSLSAQSSQDDEIRLLREQIRLLDQKLRVLERKQELKDEDAAAAAKAAAKVTVNDRGFTIASSDAANSIRLRGLVQLDARQFFNDGGGIVNNGFVLRRARPIIEGTFAKNFSFQLVPEFGGSSTTIQDATLGIALTKTAQLRIGKQKSPVGLEMLQSDSWAFFSERSLATNLVPNRDLGVQLSGDVLGGTLNYTVGIFNGVADAGNTTNADFDEDKDFAARLFAQPFKADTGSVLQGLGFGISGIIGREKTASGLTSGYRTDGQQTFFRYRTSALADGQNWRVSPQAYYYYGPLGVLAEYVVSTVNARPSAVGTIQELQNTAWQLAAGWVITGENAAYAGVVPKTNFSISDGTWGAFEAVARVARLKIDSDAFPLFADPAASANEATSIGVGLNWYLSKAVKTSFDYYQTDFATNVTPTAAVLRQDEKVLTTRFQVSF